MEIWKDIPDFNGDYQASTLGNIRNKSGKIMKQRINKHRSNYKLIRFYGAPPFLKVHRLIAKTFIPNIDNKPEVNHKNGNKENNSIQNLEWSNRKENMEHAYKTGLAGGKTYKSKLSTNDVIEIKELLNKGFLQKDIALKFNVTAGTISGIKLGKRKKYVI